MNFTMKSLFHFDYATWILAGSSPEHRILHNYVITGGKGVFTAFKQENRASPQTDSSKTFKNKYMKMCSELRTG